MDISKFEPLKIPPKGFVVFGQSQPWHLNACLHFLSDMQYGYEKGYRRAAELLVKHVAEEAKDQDTLVYPIVFLLRQLLELQLKAILEILSKIGKRKDGVPKHHDLSKLWSECKEPLNEFVSAEDKKWFGAIDELMKQIMDVDPSSDAFRFKVRMDGSPSASEIKHIHLGQLYDTIQPISDWLDATKSYLDVSLIYFSENE
jgi:hypothetical protein